ncbi:hypothetical protein [Sulfitobacter sp. TBRI5]|uniref:hypothetical protein n=1 Tax=Sulfitobacter sp. TBRI5 TaxID=2989732 RepID=UPI003D9BDE63
MTLLAAYFAICRKALSKPASFATYADIDLSVPYRPTPFIDVPAVLIATAAFSIVVIACSKSVEFLI